ncbi:invasion associated locus B family protein [Brucella sp. BE17]|uniref:invasion associated locus B family protein n=1 Tax=Brucella sp. BE17 TaxID=3142977 RepID=UPI0031BB1AA2
MNPIFKSVLINFGIVAVMTGHGFAASDTPKAVNESFGDWQVACKSQDGRQLCAAIQQVAGSIEGKPDARQRIIALEIIRAGTSAIGTMILPFGIDVSKGVSLSLTGADANGSSLPFKTCLPAGCLVPLEFGPQAVEGLKKAEKLTVSFETTADGQKKSIAVSLKGFGEAFDHIKPLEDVRQ